MPEARVKSIQDFKLPVTKKDIRAFLGTIGYYRKYIPNFASHAKPLTASTAKTAPILVTWTGEMSATFHHLRKVLCRFCVLNVPVSNDNFVLQTDASYCGVSGVLSVFREGEELPVACYSRQLKDRETRYSATEVECLAALEAIRYFEVYLVGRRFTLETDHKSLEALLTSKILNRRLSRWALYLQELTSQYDTGLVRRMEMLMVFRLGRKYLWKKTLLNKSQLRNSILSRMTTV